MSAPTPRVRKRWAAYLGRLAAMLVLFGTCVALTYWNMYASLVPTMLATYNEYRKAFRGRQSMQAVFRLLLSALIVIAWDAAVAAVLLSAAGYSLSEPASQRVIALAYWFGGFLSIGWPIPHITGVRIPIMQVLYDIPLFIAVVLARLSGERLNSLYSKVDGNLLLGSLPFPENVAELSEAGVVAVVNIEEYRAAGIQHLHLPTPDLSMPTEEDVARAVEFVHAHVGRGHVFVHCRFGMGRSASVVLAYLAKHRAMSISQAIQHVRAARPEVLRTVAGYGVLQKFVSRRKEE